MKLHRRAALQFASLGWVSSFAFGLYAQANMSPLRLLVGYSPGGATDVIARLLGVHMRAASAAMVTVENVPGASGRLALLALKRSKPTDHMAVLTPDFPLTLFPHLYRRLGYEPMADFVPVTTCGVSDFALSVGSGVPATVTTLTDYIRWCKAHPSQALYASPAPGSTPHFTGVMLAKATGVELTHVAYKGGTQALQDVLGGQVPASINPIGEVLPHLASGKMRVLATSGTQRSRFLPAVPTFSEQGFKDVVARSWMGLMAPAGASAQERVVLEKSVAEALRSAAVVEGLGKFGVEPFAISGRDFAALLQQDLKRWGPIIKASGFTIED